MNLSLLKLKAKKRLVKNNAKCFLISFLPPLSLAATGTAVYFLYSFLLTAALPYDAYTKPAALTLGIIISFIIYAFAKLSSDNFFISKSRKTGRVTFKKVLSYSVVCVMRFFLSVSWFVLYFFPCLTVSGALYYAVSRNLYGRNVFAALVSSAAVLFLIGSVFLYITLKQYSACSAVLLTEEETDALKIIAKSMEIMNGNMIRYSLFCISFFGWMISCIFILPAFYVLPYRAAAKFEFYSAVTKRDTAQTSHKPVIFYLNKKSVIN